MKYSYLSEKLRKFFLLSIGCAHRQTGLLQGLAQEIADFSPIGTEGSRLFVLGALSFVRARKKVWE